MTVTLSSVQCPVCRQMAEVRAGGQWHGSLDEMCSAAQAQAEAACPYALGRHRIRPGARKRKYRHAQVWLAEPVS
jgi:hypothetical protein